MLKEYVEELQEAVKKATKLFYASLLASFIFLVLNYFTATTWSFVFMFLFFTFAVLVFGYVTTIYDVIDDLKTRLGEQNAKTSKAKSNEAR